MTEIFRTVLVLSLKAGWAALAVILLRFVLKDTPKWTHCLLWAVVGLRLVLPFSVESGLSLVPRQETVKTVLLSGLPAEKLAEGFNETAAENSTLWTVLSVIWAIGVAALLIYAAVSAILLYKRVAVSIFLEKNICTCDDIDKPFILGIFRPRICLPSGMDADEAVYVLRHERAHLSRGDHVWKPLSFLLAAIYWFNPVIWLAYKLLGQDIELACDEKTVKFMDLTERKAYSETLLTCGMERTMLFACPVAFGEVGVQERIVSVLRYRRRAFWRTAAATVLCLVLSVSFLTDPVTARVAEAVPDAVSEAIADVKERFPSIQWNIGPDVENNSVSLDMNGITIDELKCCPYVKSVGMELDYMFTQETASYANCPLHYMIHVHTYGDVFAAIRCKNCGTELGAYYVGKGYYCEYEDRFVEE